MLLPACQPDARISDPTDFKGFTVPQHFPKPVYSFENNKVTKEGFALGRKLFYDKSLSANGKISCGSCHHQSAGFADPDKAFSTGVNGKQGLRHSPALVNLAWHPAFMADGGINHIEVMPIAPLQDSLEMGVVLPELIDRLQADAVYPAMFAQAFGSDSITSAKMLKAMAQFMGMMISANSKYDRFLKGEENLTTPEQRGYQLFELHCSDCHTGALLTDFSYRNNGLDVISKDEGRARITQKTADHGKFKVPSLRNVAVSAPYMHDGRFASLEEVIEHYSTGIQPAQNLDENLKKPITLSAIEKRDLLKFLETFTDYDYLNNTELAEIRPESKNKTQ